MILQESSQVDFSSGGSLVLIKPQDVVTDDCNHIDSSPSSAQTVETNAGMCETEEKTPPVELFKQGDKMNHSTLPAAGGSSIKGSDHSNAVIDERSQETALPSSHPSLANNSVTVDQQETARDKAESPVDQCLTQEDLVNQDEQPMDHDVHSTHQYEHSTNPDVQTVDTDIQSINQDKESIDQRRSSDQDVEDDDDNPFSQLLLFSESENDDAVPLKTTKKKKQRKARSKLPAGGKRKKTERKIPDSFVAVRFSSPELRHKLELVQQHMVEIDKKVKPTLIPLVKLHITLMTLRLNNDPTLTEK